MDSTFNMHYLDHLHRIERTVLRTNLAIAECWNNSRWLPDMTFEAYIASGLHDAYVQDKPIRLTAEEDEGMLTANWRVRQAHPRATGDAEPMVSCEVVRLYDSTATYRWQAKE